jgi:small GTP-binding protein
MECLPNAEEAQHKVVFLGDSNTGKTSIIFKYLKLVQQPFPTIAASSFPVSVPIQNSIVKLSCWDTAGQENFRCLVPMFARDAEVACLVFDQSNITSFESLERWLTYIEDEVGVKTVIVVSNKNDLEARVPVDEAFEYCTLRKLPLVATSALTGHNISFLFVKIAEMIREVSVERIRKEKAGTNQLEPNSDKLGCC